ncbi:MAG: threonine aldolase family protein [Burkholderiaceae bacterium]
MNRPLIRLNSDTETRPTPAMRQAIAQAPVGDEQRNEDPSVNALCDRVAGLLGKEAALFLPSGTMGNVVAVKTHTQPGDMLFAESSAHVLRAESGGAAMISGAVTETIHADPSNGLPPGVFSPEQLETALAGSSALPSPYSAPPRLLCVEQTHNFGGGSIWPLASLQAVSQTARSHGMAVHMDGARLLNAVVASQVSAADYCACVDSVWIDFTKGLGAPIGAVLAGSSEFINRARRYKTAVGGAMRQAGIAAGGCLYALDHHVERLASDHNNATRLANGLSALPGVELVYGPPQTNIVFFKINKPGLNATEFSARCLAQGVRVGPVAGAVRAVTHLDIADDEIDIALQVMGDIIQA